MKDPIVEEVHKVREEIAKEIKKRGISVMEYLKEIQANFKGTIVSSTSETSPKKKCG
ncbi:MAG: hypothetical protein WA705_29635 [Candidatus Ozemobacteraceae bacterium]